MAVNSSLNVLVCRCSFSFILAQCKQSILFTICQCTQSLGLRRTSRISASFELSGGLCMYSHLQEEGKLSQTAQLAGTCLAPSCAGTWAAFSEDAKLRTQLMLFASGDRYGYKSLSSIKTNNTGTDRRNVSFIFFPAFGKAATTKWRAVPPTPQFMQVY